VKKDATYTDTVTDVRKLIREEQDTERRKALQTNIDRIDAEYSAMRETVTNLRILAASSLSAEAVKAIAESGVKVLAERVEGLTWLVRGVIIATVLEIAGGVTVAWIVHGMHP
jgi:hypothetical protein